MPKLGRILVYPIKSLDPIEVTSARVLATGAIEHDRRWMIVDGSGKVFNGKRTPLVHRLRAKFDERVEHVAFTFEDRAGEFALDDVEAIEAWLEPVFGEPVRLLENAYAGFPDDTEAPGPTVISTATLETVAGWFAGLTVDEARLRFRANLEIAEVEPFWEDRLFGREGSAVDFTIGAVTFSGTNPCQRCPVPTRDSQTGEATPKFAVQFSQHRAATLPEWAEASRFNHFYRLATNTHLAGKPGVIRVGDAVT